MIIYDQNFDQKIYAIHIYDEDAENKLYKNINFLFATFSLSSVVVTEKYLNYILRLVHILKHIENIDINNNKCLLQNDQCNCEMSCQMDYFDISKFTRLVGGPVGPPSPNLGQLTKVISFLISLG